MRRRLVNDLKVDPGEWHDHHSLRCFVDAAIIRKAREYRNEGSAQQTAVRRAADFFGIPRTTVRSRMNRYGWDEDAK